MTVRIIVIAAFTLVFLYNLLLTIIHMRSAKNPIPENVSDVYDEESYLKWRSYHAEKSRFSILSSTASFAFDLILLVFNLYAAFAGLFPADGILADVRGSAAFGFVLLAADAVFMARHHGDRAEIRLQ